MTHIELYKLALDALKVLLDEHTPAREAQLKGIVAISALQDAIDADKTATPEDMAIYKQISDGYFKGLKPSEPVIAYHYKYNTAFNQGVWGVGYNVPKDALEFHPLYRHQPVPEPLTDEEIERLYLKAHDYTMNQGWGIRANAFARAIEAAIRGKK